MKVTNLGSNRVSNKSYTDHAVNGLNLEIKNMQIQFKMSGFIESYISSVHIFQTVDPVLSTLLPLVWQVDTGGIFFWKQLMTTNSIGRLLIWEK